MTGLITANTSAVFHMNIIIIIMEMTIVTTFLFFLLLSSTILAIYIALSLVKKKTLRV
jgi:hypothetical protein